MTTKDQGNRLPSYATEATVLIRRPPAEIMPWLVTPSLLSRWIIGAREVEWVDGSGPVVGGQTRLVLTTSGQSQSATAMVGQIVELTDDRLVREYRMDWFGAGPVRLDAGSAYQRTVSYRLSPAAGGTDLTCAQVTTIPGLSPRVLTMATRSETRSMVRSLARLRVRLEGGRVGPFRWLRDSQQGPQAL